MPATVSNRDAELALFGAALSLFEGESESASAAGGTTVPLGSLGGVEFLKHPTLHFCRSVQCVNMFRSVQCMQPSSMFNNTNGAVLRHLKHDDLTSIQKIANLLIGSNLVPL